MFNCAELINAQVEINNQIQLIQLETIDLKYPDNLYYFQCRLAEAEESTKLIFKNKKLIEFLLKQIWKIKK
jgi:hypothetical protein